VLAYFVDAFAYRRNVAKVALLGLLKTANQACFRLFVTLAVQPAGLSSQSENASVRRTVNMAPSYSIEYAFLKRLPSMLARILLVRGQFGRSTKLMAWSCVP